MQAAITHCKPVFAYARHMREDWLGITEPWERLKWARKVWQAANNRPKTQRDAAGAFKMSESAYSAYERAPGASRHADLRRRAREFGLKFKISWIWIVDNIGSPFDDPGAHKIDQPKDDYDSPYRTQGGIPSARAVRLVGVTLSANKAAGGEMSGESEYIPYRGFHPDPENLSSIEIKEDDDSVNQAYPPGTYVIIEPYDEARPPKSGADVALRLYTLAGEVLSIRRLVIMDGVHYFHPISTNANHTPFSERDYDIDILGHVVEFYGKREAGNGPAARKRSFRNSSEGG